ncbi:MAG: hypothetical protein C0407_04580 [Desulfobacca sp.]|nr:hypothetical protein [Desulfobacca sp.]
MLTGLAGTGFYFSGWHRGIKGKMKKLIAYSPAFLSKKTPVKFWSVAVAAPVSEVEGVIHSLYMRQIYFLLIMVAALIAGGVGIILSELRYGKSMKKEVQKAVADLKELEQRNKYLIESAEDIIVTLGEEGSILSINPYGAAQFEKTADDLLGRNILDFFDPKSASLQANFLKRVSATKKSKSLEYQAFIGNKEYWLHANFKPLMDEKENIISVLGIIRNVTESKVVEHQLAHTEKLASLGSLAAGVAHEINNPLGVILGYCDYMLDKIPPEDKVHKILEKIERQGNHCKKIVENLLSFSRYTEHSDTISDINANLENVVAVAENNLMIKKIHLKKELEKNLPRVKADPVQLQQVFLNLINNAVAAMPSGGMLTIESHWDVYADRIHVLISDTGLGIQKEHRSRIYDPFFTTKKVGEGTGLGLTVSYGIIHHYQGAIGFESQTVEEDPVNHGTSFTVTLPVYHSKRVGEKKGV